MDNTPKELLTSELPVPVTQPNNSLKYILGGFVVTVFVGLIVVVFLYSQNNSPGNPIPADQNTNIQTDNSITSNSNFFITKIQKPIAEVDFIDIPNNKEIRNVVEYKDSVFAAGNGAIVRYSKESGEVTGYSDVYKAYCDGELAIIGSHLFAACRIDNINDPFGTTTVETTKFFSGHIGVLKINLDTDKLEKTFAKEDGLLNQYNFKLYPDGSNLWIGTFNGLALIDTSTDSVTFFHDELGYSEINQSYGVNHMLIDSGYVWAFFGAHDKSQGGISLYDKKTSQWKAFSPTDLMEFPDRFDLDFAEGYFAKLIPGGIQIGFRDGKLGDFDRLVEKKYEYSTEKWAIIGEHITTGPEYELTRKSMMKVYPSVRYYERDYLGSTQILLPSDSSKLTINGRINYFLSPVIGDKRYILTDSTIDMLELSAPFRRTIVSLGESLSPGSAIYDGMQESTGFKFLVDPITHMSLVIDYTCGGMTCDNSQNVWLADFSDKKLSKVYTGNELPIETLSIKSVKLTTSGTLMTVSSESGDIFEVDTSTKVFRLLMTPTPSQTR